MGQHGLSCDNTLSYDIVTANGELITASADEHPDPVLGTERRQPQLGVVTSITYRLHPVGAVISGMLLHPLARERGRTALLPPIRVGRAPGRADRLCCRRDWPGRYAAPRHRSVLDGVDLDEGERVLAPFARRPASRGPLARHAVHGDAAASSTPPRVTAFGRTGSRTSSTDCRTTRSTRSHGSLSRARRSERSRCSSTGTAP